MAIACVLQLYRWKHLTKESSSQNLMVVYISFNILLLRISTYIH
jgi:hypothetical protein